MVKFRSLYNDPENRMIREIIDGTTGPITIFEPSQSDIDRIMQMNDVVSSFNAEPADDEEGATLDVHAETILKELIPLLTDIEIEDDMTEGEMQKIIENPTIDLLNVTEVLSGIVTQVYTFMLLRYRNLMDMEDMTERSEDTKDATMDRYVSAAAKTDEGRMMLSGLAQNANELSEAKANNMTKAKIKEQIRNSEGAIASGLPESDQEVDHVVGADLDPQQTKLSTELDEKYQGI